MSVSAVIDSMEGRVSGSNGGVVVLRPVLSKIPPSSFKRSVAAASSFPGFSTKGAAEGATVGTVSSRSSAAACLRRDQRVRKFSGSSFFRSFRAAAARHCLRIGAVALTPVYRMLDMVLGNKGFDDLLHRFRHRHRVHEILSRLRK